MTEKKLTKDTTAEIIWCEILLGDIDLQILVGDFNHPDLVWTSEGGKCHSNRLASANDFLDTISSNFIIQNVYEPTFGNNILDLILTEQPNRIFEAIFYLINSFDQFV